MTATDYSEWVGKIHRKVAQLRIVFLQLGASNEPARRALFGSEIETISVSEYLEWESTRISSGIVAIDNLESFSNADRAKLMGRLRERVFEDVEAGLSMILVSRSPRISFPNVVGSSLLDDASFAHAPAVNDRSGTGWPTSIEDSVPTTTVLKNALSELGIDLCAALDRVVYEHSLTGEDALGLLSARELEALDGAGITAPDSKSIRVWNFPRHLVALKSALDEVLADALEPQQQLAQVSADLWKIERIIRRTVRERAVLAWGKNWRTQCFNQHLATQVLERATESAYLSSNSIKNLRDPLEWLSLGELLQLRERSEIGNLGLSPAQWRLFSTQILPVRNRLAHIRNLHVEDMTNATKWRKVLESRLSSGEQFKTPLGPS